MFGGSTDASSRGKNELDSMMVGDGPTIAEPTRGMSAGHEMTGSFAASVAAHSSPAIL
jgi:hypothetical protein